MGAVTNRRKARTQTLCPICNHPLWVNNPCAHMGNKSAPCHIECYQGRPKRSYRKRTGGS